MGGPPFPYPMGGYPMPGMGGHMGPVPGMGGFGMGTFGMVRRACAHGEGLG